MATVSYVFVKGPDMGQGFITRWANMATADVGGAVKVGGSADKTVHVYAANVGGASITLRGSNLENPDPTVAADWFIMHDENGDDLTFTAVGGHLVAESPLWISPLVTGGTAVDVTVALFTQKGSR